jgi:hypothetical protein
MSIGTMTLSIQLLISGLNLCIFFPASRTADCDGQVMQLSFLLRKLHRARVELMEFHQAVCTARLYGGAIS